MTFHARAGHRRRRCRRHALCSMDRSSVNSETHSGRVARRRRQVVVDGPCTAQRDAADDSGRESVSVSGGRGLWGCRANVNVLVADRERCWDGAPRRPRGESSIATPSRSSTVPRISSGSTSSRSGSTSSRLVGTHLHQTVGLRVRHDLEIYGRPRRVGAWDEPRDASRRRPDTASTLADPNSEVNGQFE